MVVQAVPNGFGFGGRVFGGSKPQNETRPKRFVMKTCLRNVHAVVPGVAARSPCRPGRQRLWRQRLQLLVELWPRPGLLLLLLMLRPSAAAHVGLHGAAALPQLPVQPLPSWHSELLATRPRTRLRQHDHHRIQSAFPHRFALCLQVGEPEQPLRQTAAGRKVSWLMMPAAALAASGESARATWAAESWAWGCQLVFGRGAPRFWRAG